MKSRDEVVIITLQWMRLYTLGSKGSRELKTFLKIFLISSRIDQKLREKKGEYTGFKGKIRLDFEGHLIQSWARNDGSWKRFPLGGFVTSLSR